MSPPPGSPRGRRRRERASPAPPRAMLSVRPIPGAAASVSASSPITPSISGAASGSVVSPVTASIPGAAASASASSPVSISGGAASSRRDLPPPSARSSAMSTAAQEMLQPRARSLQTADGRGGPRVEGEEGHEPRQVAKEQDAGIIHKKKPTKKFTSPIVPAVVRSPGIKFMMAGSPITTTNSPTATLMPSNSNSKRSNSSGSSQKKRRKLKSEIWSNFEPTYNGNTLAEARCIHCNAVFNVSRSVGSSSCLRHIESCGSKNKANQIIDQLSSASSSDQFKDWKFNAGLARDELVKFIVLHGLPFSIVEYPKFRSFVASLNPWFPSVSRTTIRSECLSTYQGAKSVLRENLSTIDSRVSLTADLWTSNQNMGYLCVTCHFIDAEWRLFKRIITFTLVETPHNGKNMFNAMLKAICDWGIEDKIFSVTLDNATVNDSFVSALRGNLVSKRLLFRKGELFHCRCAAHVLNLIVQEGLSVISSAVNNIRDSVKYIRSSQGRKERFEKMVKQVGISLNKRPSLDVVTRWNSTYYMLDSAYMYRRAFESLTREDPQYVHEPIDKEWELSQKMCDILETFCSATKAVSGSKYPTSSSYFHQLWEVKKVLEIESSNSDPNVMLMVQKMKGKFQKYWDLSYMQICIPVILDPRFKLGFIKFRLQQGFGDKSYFYFSKVEKMFRDLFDEYSLQFNGSTPESAFAASDELDVDDPWADWGMHQNIQHRNKISELELYLDEEMIPVGVNLDILQYWKTFSPKYPILGRIARDVLAVPASSVASESAFSSAAKTISDYRSKLGSNTVEALVCLQDWLRENDSTLDDIAGNAVGDNNEEELEEKRSGTR